MEQKVLLEEQCAICEDRKQHGIHLYHLYICRECEHTMIHTEPREEKYEYYLKKLKPITKPALYS